MKCEQLQHYLQSQGIAPNTDLGQHFLCDEIVLQDILHASRLHHDDIVLEVGPGLGVLTLELAKHAHTVYGIELDKTLFEQLIHTLQKNGVDNVVLLRENIVRFSIDQFCQERLLSSMQYKMVSNLPYSVSSRVLRMFLEHPCKPSTMTVLLQKEVAQRASAEPGSMSMLSVLIQAYSTPVIVRNVAAESFWPPPAVESAILHLDIKKTWEYRSDPQDFFRVAKIGFASKRKQLLNTLSAGFLLSKEKVHTVLSHCQIDPTRRAETLTCEEWDAVTQVLLPNFS